MPNGLFFRKHRYAGRGVDGHAEQWLTSEIIFRNVGNGKLTETGDDDDDGENDDDGGGDEGGE